MYFNRLFWITPTRQASVHPEWKPHPAAAAESPFEQFRDRSSRLRIEALAILAQQREHGRRNLALRDRFDLRPLARGLGIGSHRGQPDVFRRRNLFSVRLPLGTIAAAMIDGQDQGGGAAVLR